MAEQKEGKKNAGSRLNVTHGTRNLREIKLAIFNQLIFIIQKKKVSP